MPPNDATTRPPTPLMEYLKGIQERPGWSIARVARESGGRISRATLFRMMSGETTRVSIETLKLIVEIVGDDPGTVFDIAVGSVPKSEHRDPRLEGLDPNDTIVRHIMLLNIDEEMRGFMLDRRRQQVAEQRERDMREIEREVEFWTKRRRGAV